VRPDLQDRQLGRTLLAEAEAWAGKVGARRIRMTVVGIRDSLIAWYQRRGYVLTGETRPFPYENREIGVTDRRDLDFVVLEKAI
jgi:GNAT superfamily N-acetyltransferase